MHYSGRSYIPMTPKNVDAEFLLFLPDKVAEVVHELSESVTERLLQRDINAFDWHIKDLWRAAVYHTISPTPVNALPYYHKLLEWTEADAEQHSQVLCATAHVFTLENEFEDALQMLKIAINKAISPGKIPFFIAKITYAQKKIPQTLNAINFFLNNYAPIDPLRLHAQSIHLMLLDEAGQTHAAQNLLSLMAQEQNTWESHCLAATFSPYINLEPLPEDIQTIQSQHKEALSEHVFSPHSSPLFAWYLAQRYKSAAAPYGPEYKSEFHQFQTGIKERMDFLIKNVFTSPNRQAYPAEQKRIVIIGDFTQTGITDLSTLFISLCRQQSVTLISTGKFPLDISEEHWIRTLSLDPRLEQAYLQVSMQQPDLLIYLHTGHLHKYINYLETQRLAPWQVIWATDPITTISEKIDEVLLYEKTINAEQISTLLPNIQSTYLPGTPVKKARTLPKTIDASHFNFSPERRYYFCPFPVTEIHPSFYPVCAEILQKDPAGDILFLASKTPVGELQWRKQLKALYPDVETRMHILPPLNPTAEMGVIQNVQLLLEPFYNPLKHAWWQWMTLGTPAIHYNDHELTGIWLKKMYEHIEWNESCVDHPKDYANCAVALAKDPEVKLRYQARLKSETRDFNALAEFVQQWTNEKLKQSLESKPTQ